MKAYDVTIAVRLTKTYRVPAHDEDDAYVQAHEIFSMNRDGASERYEQETLDIVEVTDENQ